MPDDCPAKRPGPRDIKEFADGWSDKLEPLEPFDVTSAASASEILAQMSRTSFGGRNLGEAADVLHEMVADEKCLVVGTFSGAMTIAKMGLLITDMIDHGMLDAIVSTGALMCHGLIEQTGCTHFRHDPKWSDEELYKAGYDRVYDTLELEANLYHAEKYVVDVCRSFGAGQPFGSAEFTRRLGEALNADDSGRGILQSAVKRDVPVYVPAFTDSELGLDVFTYNLLGKIRGTHAPARFDPYHDLEDYYRRIEAAERLGIFTIGGGVPRNWAQQVGPLGELIHSRTGGECGGLIRFRYGVRICPEPVHWGGLSGCTYSEGITWGKFVPPAEGGRFAEVMCDATIAWPLLVRGVMERMGKV